MDSTAHPPDPPGPPGAVPGLPPPLAGGGDRFERWAAEARVEEAARARAREGWLRRQAEESATLAGVVADLQERGVPVTVHTRAGGRHTGAVRAVGADVVVVRTAPGAGPGGDVLVPLAALTAVRAGPGTGPAVGDRRPGAGPTFTDLLVDLAADRAAVRVATVGGDAVAGVLRAVGRDVLVVTPASGGTAHVALGAVAEVAVEPPAPG
ncbi:MAG TPA: hypothetical protein VKZ72_11050 [Acidimicrobiales bacterium]|nr:hypothetical protein [Acidimicrobiales bacterium]